MSDEAPKDQGAAPADPGERAGDFERYALIAALTLVVLCLLVWDNWHGGSRPSVPGPRPDRALRVEIGGGPQGGAGGGAAPAPPPRVAVDPPPAPAPPPEPAQRTYVVKSGDTLEGIAKRELGSPGRVKDIAEMNHLADADKLKLGQILVLPAK
jgi:hypothetical protein